jgi:hypothetical protein
VSLTVTFVRHRQRRDRVYVARGDGTSTFWDFPSYGDRLPHDLCHLVVEDGLGIVDGFWGMVDRGVEVRLVDNQATLVRHGRPLVDEPGVDFSDLRRAEDAVAYLGSGGVRPEPVDAVTVTHLDATTEAALSSTRQRLADLGRRRRALSDGDAITLAYAGPE